MPRWRHTVEVKKYLLNNLSDAKVKVAAEAIIPQLKLIYIEEDILIEHNPRKAIDFQLLSDLEDIISNLEWIVESIVKKDNVSEHSFNTWFEAIRDELRMLITLGHKTTNDEKFIRVI